MITFWTNKPEQVSEAIHSVEDALLEGFHIDGIRQSTKEKIEEMKWDSLDTIVGNADLKARIKIDEIIRHLNNL